MSQFALKLMALLVMLLDHTAHTVLNTGVLIPWIGMSANRQLYTWMRVIGRMAFPIFAWFAAEGCRKTSDPRKRMLRIGLFMLLSEIPFQLCFQDGLELGLHNVIATIFLASSAIEFGRIITFRGAIPNLAAQAAPAILAIILGFVLKTDYNGWGVALILALYYIPQNRNRLLFLAAWVTVFQLIWHGWDGNRLIWLFPSGRIVLLYWLFSLLSVGRLATYQGERGPRCRWLFYLFYPCHLLLLYGVKYLITHI